MNRDRLIDMGIVLASGLAAGIGIGLFAGNLGGSEQPTVTVTRAVAPERAHARHHSRAPTATTATPSPQAPRGWVDAGGLRRRVAGVATATGAEVGVTLRSLDGGGPVTAGPLQREAAWSTIKVPIALARYRLGGGAEVEQLATAAIEQSDNAAAQALFDGVAAQLGGSEAGYDAVEATLREAGDTETRVNRVRTRPEFSTYGQTSWSLAAGTRFYAALARRCLAPADADEHIATLMANVTPEQRWGLGRLSAPQGAIVSLKGGWGPSADGRYLVRQFGFVRLPSGEGIVVGLMARAADGGFESGTAVLDELATAVGDSVRWTALGDASACPAG